eukprot:Clim_evm101s172 gene=Clim_evmTU101s172
MVQSFNSAGIALALRAVFSEGVRQQLKPHAWVRDISAINFPAVRKELGIKAAIFDKDNTLTQPYAHTLAANLEEAWDKAKTVFPGRVYILSNSTGSNDRKFRKEAEVIEKSLGCKVLVHRPKKPAGGQEICERLGLKGSEIMVVGDRVLTDVAFGRSIGALTVLVDIITRENDNSAARFARDWELWWLRRNLEFRGDERVDELIQRRSRNHFFNRNRMQYV